MLKLSSQSFKNITALTTLFIGFFFIFLTERFSLLNKMTESAIKDG